MSFEGGRKQVLLVLFIPSVERDGTTEVDQAHWVTEALAFLGATFGGATAYPRARGVWRDDERSGALVFDDPVVMHCYVTPEMIENEQSLLAVGLFCRRLGRETRQGEIGLVIDDEYFAFSDFEEESV